jgi:hypothetical protein
VAAEATVSKRGLLVLSLIVLALAGVVLVDRPRPPLDPGVRDRILEGFSAAQVSALRVHDVVLERHGNGMELVAPGRFATDEAAVRELLGALEYLSFRRKLPAESEKDAARGLDAPRVVVQVTDTSGATTEVRVGKTEPALGRTWIAVAGRREVYLVDAYAARSLDVSADELRRREPFHFVADEVDRILVLRDGKTVTLHGQPLCVEVAGGCAHADRARVGEVLDRLADLKVTRFLKERGASGVHLVVGGEELTVGGACPDAPDERRIDSSAIGPACVAGAAGDALSAVAADPIDWVARGPISLAVAQIDTIELPGGARLERGKKGWTAGDKELDDEGMRAWLGELASYRAQAVVAPPATPGEKLILHAGERRETLALTEDKDRVLVRRDDEPVALAFHPALRRYFHTDAEELRDRRVLTFDGYALSAIELATGDVHERAVRAGSTDAFQLSEPLEIPADGATIDRLRDTASGLRARRVVTKALPGQEAHFSRSLALTVDPPPGSPDGATPTRLELELSEPLGVGGGDCYARRHGESTMYLLAAEPCAALTAHLATRALFHTELDDVTAVTVLGARYERHGPSWYGPDGAALEPALAAAISQLVQRLQNASVAGYGRIEPAGAQIVVETTTQKITLRTRPGELQLEGRDVRYAVPREVCARWPGLCK